MSEQHGEKTEFPTARKLEEAYKRGQFPRSTEVQTLAVLGATMLGLSAYGQSLWQNLRFAFTGILPHLHDLPLTADDLQAGAASAMLYFVHCVWPAVASAVIAGVVVGLMQSRLRINLEAIEFNWERVDPIAGLKRLFSLRAATTTGIGLLKLGAIIALTYGHIARLLDDPIFTSAVGPAKIAQFLASTSFNLVMQVLSVLLIVAVMDFAYQFWQNQQDLMMTREEVIDEAKNQEGNPQIKSRRQKMRQRQSKRQMLLDVEKADVVITNPTHLAIALGYDRRSSKAPVILAKGARLLAKQIREIAEKHQIPIVENKPLARMMYKYGQVGGEIPAHFYQTVAEILAWVYRVNRYRYYAQDNKTN